MVERQTQREVRRRRSRLSRRPRRSRGRRSPPSSASASTTKRRRSASASSAAGSPTTSRRSASASRRPGVLLAYDAAGRPLDAAGGLAVAELDEATARAECARGRLPRAGARARLAARRRSHALLVALDHARELADPLRHPLLPHHRGARSGRGARRRRARRLGVGATADGAAQGRARRVDDHLSHAQEPRQPARFRHHRRRPPKPAPGAARSRRSSRACCAGPRGSRWSFPATTDGTRREGPAR